MKKLTALLLIIALLPACFVFGAADTAPLPVCSLTMDGCLEWLRGYDASAETVWRNASWDLIIPRDDFGVCGEMLADGTVTSFSLYADETVETEECFTFFEKELELFSQMTGISFEDVHDTIHTATEDSQAFIPGAGAYAIVTPYEMTVEYADGYPAENRIEITGIQELVAALFEIDGKPGVTTQWFVRLTGTGFLYLGATLTENNRLQSLVLTDKRNQPEETRSAFRSLAELWLSGDDLVAAYGFIDACIVNEKEKFTESLKQEEYTLRIKKSKDGSWAFTCSLKNSLLNTCGLFAGDSTSTQELALAALGIEGVQQMPVAVPTAAAAPVSVEAEGSLKVADLAGLWKLTSLTLNDGVYTPREIGFRTYLDFSAEKKEIDYVVQLPGMPTERGTGTYDTSGNQIMFHLFGLNEIGEYDAEKETITGTFTWIGNVPIVIERASPEETLPPPPTPTPEPKVFELNAETEPLTGTWELVLMQYPDHEISREKLEQYGIMEILVLNPDGSAAYRDMNNDISDLTWFPNDGVIELYRNGKLYDTTFRYDAEKQEITATSKDTLLFFMKEVSE